MPDSMVAPKDKATSYRPDIDGLRAIAITSVVAFHAGIPGVTGGFVGVDVFFVISGYLITALLFQELESTGSVHLAAFYARRVRRLLPALLAMVAVTLLLALLVMFPLDLRRLGRSATAVMLVVSNLHFLEYSGGYFDPSTDLMPLLHTWSLSIEEQYYLTWPLLLLVLGRLARRSRKIGAETLALLALGAILALSFAASLWYLKGEQPAAAFYLMPARAWELALGGFVWLLQRRIALPMRAGGALAASGLAAIAATVFLIDDNTRFPGIAALPPTLGAAAALFGLRYAGSDGAVKRLLAAGPMVRIGLLSYSWYLWHWPLLSLGRTYFLGARDPLRDGLVVLLALLVSYASYRLIECPIRYRKPWLFAKPRGALLLGAALSLLVIFVASGVNHWGKVFDARLVAQSQKLAPAAEQPFGTGKCQEPKDGLHLAPQDECILGGGSRGVALAAWGDSHTGHLANMLDEYSGAVRQGILVRASKYCPPLLGALPYKKGEGMFPCARFNGGVADEMAALAKTGTRGIVLASRWNVYLNLMPTDPGRTSSVALLPDRHQIDAAEAAVPTEDVPQDSASSARTMVEALRATLEQFRRDGLRVLIVAPTPELYFNGPQCIYRKSDAECVVPRHRVDERRALALRSLREGAAGFDNVRIWDPIDQFCDAQWCYTVRDGLLMYRDADHISAGMSRRLLPAAKPYLDWLVEPR